MPDGHNVVTLSPCTARPQQTPVQRHAKKLRSDAGLICPMSSWLIASPTTLSGIVLEIAELYCTELLHGNRKKGNMPTRLN